MESSSGKELEGSASQRLIPSSLYGHAAIGASLILMGYFVAYLIRFESLMGLWTGPAILIVVVAVMVMVLLTVRREERGLRFGRAFGLALLSGMGARLGYSLFQFLLFHVIRPDLSEAYVQLTKDMSIEAFSAWGWSLPPEILDRLETSIRDSLSFTGILLDALSSGLWIALVALIVAAFMYRRLESGNGFNG